jgi:hypothetical protein
MRIRRKDAMNLIARLAAVTIGLSGIAGCDNPATAGAASAAATGSAAPKTTSSTAATPTETKPETKPEGSATAVESAAPAPSAPAKK